MLLSICEQLSIKHISNVLLLVFTYHATVLQKQSHFWTYNMAMLTVTTWKPHLLQLIMTSSGRIFFFSIPCLGWSPLPRKSPGGSILKFPMRSRWWSNTQNPYSSTIFWLTSLLTWRTFINSEEHWLPSVRDKAVHWKIVTLIYISNI